MKKIFTLMTCAVLAAAAWGDNVVTLNLNTPLNPETVQYDATGVWTECFNVVD